MFRIGQGIDVHKLVEGRDLWIAGVKIPYHMGLLGHSDADVALHALCDALLGAAAMRDIGYHFPDTDPKYKNADSRVLLRDAMALVRGDGFEIDYADMTVIAQMPKMAPYIEAMRAEIASVMGVDLSRVNVKATTEEKMGFTGRGEGIRAHAVCLLKE